MRWQAFLDRCQNFWVGPVDAVRLDAFRMLTAACLLFYLLRRWPYAEEWLTASGFHVQKGWYVFQPIVFPLLPRAALPWLGGLCFGSVLALLIGWHRRLAAAAAFGCLLYISYADLLMVFTINKLFLVSLAVFVLAPRRIPGHGSTPAQHSAWPVRILQTTLLLSYFGAGWCKAYRGDWLNDADVLWTQVQGLYRTELAAWLLWVLPLGVWSWMQDAALTFELSAPLLFAWRPLRLTGFLWGIGFQLMVALTMYELIYFSLQLMTYYVLFMDPERLHAIGGMATRGRARRVGCGAILAAGLLAVSGGFAGAAEDAIPAPVEYIEARQMGEGRLVAEFLSPVYTIDRVYRSMQGPKSTQRYLLAKTPLSDVLWIIGYRTELVGADGVSPMPKEFMCHSSLDFVDVQRHGALFSPQGKGGRLFTLSQGNADLRFPRGFGIPMRSNEPMALTTQVLNLNVTGRSLQVRNRVQLELLRDAQAATPMTPLYATNVTSLKWLEGAGGGYWNVERPDPARHGPGCLVGTNASSAVYEDAQGRRFTGHWVVKPGREVNHTLVTKALALPYDTTLHYAVAHLHPFGESLELRDLTTDQTVMKLAASDFSDRIGVEKIDSVASDTGIPLFKNHEYELVCIYDNTTPVDQDAMGSLFLYLRDRRALGATGRSPAASRDSQRASE